jgi:hypothetical protein
MFSKSIIKLLVKENINDFNNSSIIIPQYISVEENENNYGSLCRHVCYYSNPNNILCVHYNHELILKSKIINENRLSDKFHHTVDKENKKGNNVWDERNHIIYLTDDINNNTFYTNLEQYNTGIFFCNDNVYTYPNKFKTAISNNLHLNNGFEKIIARLSAKLQTLYISIEGISKNILQRYILDYTTFTSIEYKENNIFRCSRTLLSSNDINNKILYKLNNVCNNNSKEGLLLCVQGEGGTGKSTLKKNLIYYLDKNTKCKFDLNNIPRKGKEIIDSTNTICIRDDCCLANYNDYKKKYKLTITMEKGSFIYTNYGFDTAFIINYDIKTRFYNRPLYISHISEEPYLYSNTFIKNIYHSEVLFNINERDAAIMIQKHMRKKLAYLKIQRILSEQSKKNEN